MPKYLVKTTDPRYWFTMSGATVTKERALEQARDYLKTLLSGGIKDIGITTITKVKK